MRYLIALVFTGMLLVFQGHAQTSGEYAYPSLTGEAVDGPWVYSSPELSGASVTGVWEYELSSLHGSYFVDAGGYDMASLQAGEFSFYSVDISQLTAEQVQAFIADLNQALSPSGQVITLSDVSGLQSGTFTFLSQALDMSILTAVHSNVVVSQFAPMERNVFRIRMRYSWKDQGPRWLQQIYRDAMAARAAGDMETFNDKAAEYSRIADRYLQKRSSW